MGTSCCDPLEVLFYFGRAALLPPSLLYHLLKSIFLLPQMTEGKCCLLLRQGATIWTRGGSSATRVEGLIRGKRLEKPLDGRLFVFNIVVLTNVTALMSRWISSFLLPGEEWYLCRLTLTTPGQAGLQWTMFPRPYLAAVGPDATPGTVVYHLSARQREDAHGSAQFFLLDGKTFIHNNTDIEIKAFMGKEQHIREHSGGCRQPGGGFIYVLFWISWFLLVLKGSETCKDLKSGVASPPATPIKTCFLQRNHL